MTLMEQIARHKYTHRIKERKYPISIHKMEHKEVTDTANRRQKPSCITLLSYMMAQIDSKKVSGGLKGTGKGISIFLPAATTYILRKGNRRLSSETKNTEVFLPYIAVTLIMADSIDSKSCTPWKIFSLYQ